ncbi:MAG: hypothetical protein WDM91_21075 [Rhizomicrobium sp.]
MSTTQTLFAPTSAQLARAKVMTRGIGKSNTSRTLDSGCGDEERFRERAAAFSHRAGASQNGTDTGVPPWNTIALQPAFVAQVIGQVLMQAQPVRSSLAVAYGRVAQVGTGALCDRDA